jgi:hypothetical protein
MGLLFPGIGRPNGVSPKIAYTGRGIHVKLFRGYSL